VLINIKFSVKILFLPTKLKETYQMKRLLLLTMLIGFSLASSAQTKSTSYPESGFKVNFPQKPATEKQSFDSAVGKIDMTLYTCSTDTYMMMISENKFPQELITKLDKAGIQGLLTGSKDGGLKNVATQMGAELKIISNEEFLFNNKYQALKTIGKISDYNFTAIYIMRNNQMYQIIAIGDTSTKEATDFLNSFSVID
jgi:hypothetical protein